VHIKVAPEAAGKPPRKFQLKPGMTATVEIKGEKRTVLSYLAKPVIKTVTQSLGER
jgi:adhesin transport system membrane fusion protein